MIKKVFFLKIVLSCLVLLATVNVKAVENDTIRISYVWDFSELDENGDSIWYFGKDIGQKKPIAFISTLKEYK